MKRYIRASADNAEFFSNYPYYCCYRAGNETWGYNAKELLAEVGGTYQYIGLPDPSNPGKYYKPWHYYFFRTPKDYYKFIDKLRDAELVGLIQLQGLREVATGATIDPTWVPNIWD